MKFSILLFIIQIIIKVKNCFAVIYTLKIGDPVTCGCLTYYYVKREISWTLQKVNGENIPLITNCPYPYNNCSVQNYKGDIFLEVNKTVNKITIQHVKQDMLQLRCLPDYFREYTDNCILNVVDSFGATSIDSPIYTLNKEDQFTSECNLIGSPSLEWTLQKVNGEMITLVTACYKPYINCVIQYDPTNFILETEDKNAYMQKYSSLPPMFVSKLTVKHVDKDMLRVFCSSDGFGKGRDRCLMNVVDYVRPDNSSSNSTAKNTAICRSRMPSTTPSPGVYFITHPTQSFLTTPFPPTSDKQPNTVVLLICVIALPIIGAVAIPTLFLWGCYRWKNRKALQRQNEDMTATSNTPQLTPATVPRTDHNDLRSTHVNPPVHQSNNTPTTQSPEHTASIQTPAPKDSPPPYSSLLEPPPYTILPADSYNRDYVPSHQEQNEPPPYTTRYTETYNSESPSAQLQAPNEPPPPYTVCIPAETPQMVFVG